MKITRSDGKLSSTRYTKPTDTGFTLNFHSIAPTKYKKSMVAGFVHRMYRACSSWENFHISLTRAKEVLENNQYPSRFYEPIIKIVIDNILRQQSEEVDENNEEEKEVEEKMIFIQYRGKVTEKFEQALKRIQAPCKMIQTIRKLKTILPSLKAPVEKPLKSMVVYKICCSRCDACYVGQTTRHLITRFKEHLQKGPIKSHIKNCNKITIDDVEIITRTNRNSFFLMTLEALHIKDIKPDLNTKDEYRSRTLTIKL